jgi:Fe-S-cluster containining protein
MFPMNFPNDLCYRRMNMVFETHLVTTPFYAGFIERLKKIYAAMDQAYRRAADHYRFNCDGCRDNCCRSRFYHHTVIEHAYLLEGLRTLTIQKQSEVKSRAMNVVDQTSGCNVKKGAIRRMCPLNFDQLCILYPYRPMICRLHGIPHELKKPGQDTLFGPGCQTFDQRCGRKSSISFDRTPFYRELAGLEQAVRQTLGCTGKIRMTVSEMILADA